MMLEGAGASNAAITAGHNPIPKQIAIHGKVVKPIDVPLGVSGLEKQRG